MAIEFVAGWAAQNNKISSVSWTNPSSIPTGVTTKAPYNCFLFVVFDNLTATTPTVTSITQNAVETGTWVQVASFNSPQAAAAGGVRGELWRLDSEFGGTFGWSLLPSVTLSGAVAAKAMVYLQFTGVGALVTAPSVGTTSITSSVTVGELVLRAAGTEAAAAPTIGGSGSNMSFFGSATLGTTGGSAVTNAWALMSGQTPISNATNATWTATLTDGGQILARFAPAPDPVLSQAAYRFYADGTESGSVALAAQNTAPTVDTSGGDVPVQLRVRVQETGTGPVPYSSDFALQYEKNTSGSWVDVRSPVLSGATGGEQSGQNLDTSFPSMAQSFMGDGRTLTRARFLLISSGSPTGAVTAELRAHDAGTFGQTGKPGAVLATSTNSVPASSIPEAPNTWYDFDFDGTYTMAAGTPYFITVTANNAPGTQVIVWSKGTEVPGAQARLTAPSTWTVNTGLDLLHQVLAPDVGTVRTYDSPNLDNNATTTNRLGAGTGSFVPGDITEDGVANDFGWAQGNYTELLYGLKLVAADLTAGDTLRFRVVRDGAVLGTYAQVPTLTIGTAGPQVWQVSGTVAVTSTASVAQVVANMVPNPSIENGITGYPGQGATASTSTVWASNRSTSLRLTPGVDNDSSVSVGGDSGGGLRLGMQAGRTYTVLGTIHLEAAQAGTLHPRARRIVVHTFNGAYDIPESSQAPNAAGTTELRLTFTVPADATAAWIRLYNGSSTSTDLVYWDSIMLIEGAYDGPYIDGATGGTWAGTPDDSVTMIDGVRRVPIVHQASGSVAVTTAVAGAATVIVPAVTHQASGTVAVNVAASGTVTKRAPVSGSVPVVVGTTGTVSARLRAAGTVPVITTATGDATRVPLTLQVSGTVPVVTVATGDVTVTSSAQTHQVSGSVAVVTNATGTIGSQSLAVSGTVPVVVGATGTIRRIQPVSGSVPVVIGASGAVSARLRVAGTASIVVDASGTATIVGPEPIQVSGTVAVITSATGAVGAQTLAVSGTVPVVTTVAGAIGSQSLAVSGSVPVVTQTSGTIRRIQQVSGTVAVNTAASGAVTARLPVSGTVPVVVGAVGMAGSTQGVSGTVVVVTSASGSVIPTGGMQGTVPVTVGVSGSVTSKQGVAGAPVAVTVGVSGAVTVKQATSGTVPVTVGVSGAVQVNPRGRVDVVVGVSGTVSQVHQVSGTVAVTTASSGTVIARLPVSGTVPVVTAATGNATSAAGAQQYQVSGTVAVVTTTTGVVTKRSQVVGTVAVVTAASGTVAARMQIAGVVPVTTAASGSIFKRMGVSGTVVVITTTTGFIYVPDPPPFPCGGLTLTPSGPLLPLSAQGIMLTLRGEAVTLPSAETPEGYSVTKTAGQLTLEGVC